jgi:hypothetical protein
MFLAVYLVVDLSQIKASVTPAFLENIPSALRSAYSAFMIAASVCCVALVGSVLFRWIWRNGGTLAILISVSVWRSADPESYLFDHLRMALSTLVSEDVATISRRRRLASHLAEAASVLDGAIPRRLWTGDSDARRVFRQRCREGAEALRQYQVWIALPASQTQADLALQIGRIIAVVCSGLYDYLPSAQVSARQLGRRLATSILRLGRLMFVAIFPLIFMAWILPHLTLVPPSSESWLRSLAIIWLIISLVFPLDPLFSPKIAALKDAVSSFRSGSAK